ncbi:MAG: hypothetical protein U9R60_04420, partial [Bacteroidota bacterium]|nr:hypothetical protein [Bacteroidota bacterium]
GQNVCADGGTSYGSVLGHAVYDNSYSYDLKYWWFERLEIKNGSNVNTSHSTEKAAGFFAGGGPFKFRYCYIHDNVCSSGNANPGGLKGHHWHDSVIEFCYFNNNGIPAGPHAEPVAHILLYSDYNWQDTSINGFYDNDTQARPIKRNIIRYNYFVGSPIGFKHKGAQLFSGRNPDAGHGWDDTYNTYGDKIHHNIFEGASHHAIGAHQDFAQVFNNIINECARGIQIQYEPGRQLYKVVTYNNNIINPPVEALIRYASDGHPQGLMEPKEHYGWDYNNIFDSAGDYWSYSQTHNLNAVPITSSGTVFSLTDYYCTDNYFYRPDNGVNSNLFRLQANSFTASGFESQTLTHAPRNAYANDYNAGDPLYQGSSGADKYKTRGDHLLEGSITIANGGIGGAHPYLTDITIPSYVGATNPNDNVWVDGVLSLANVTTLRNAGDGDPSWIEGRSSPGEVPGIPPSFEQS